MAGAPRDLCEGRRRPSRPDGCETGGDSRLGQGDRAAAGRSAGCLELWPVSDTVLQPSVDPTPLRLAPQAPRATGGPASFTARQLAPPGPPSADVGRRTVDADGPRGPSGL